MFFNAYIAYLLHILQLELSSVLILKQKIRTVDACFLQSMVDDTCWTERLIVLFGIIFCYGLFIREIATSGCGCNPKCNTNSNNKVVFWSVLTIISCIFHLLVNMLNTVLFPVWCINILSTPPLMGSKIFFTFLQVTGLYYCSKEIYAPSLFYILYIIGASFIVYTIIYALMQQGNCNIYPDSLFLVRIIGASLFITWHIFVLCLYIFRLMKLKTEVLENNPNQLEQLRKVDIFLHKVVFLTIVSVFVTIVNIIMTQFGGIGYSIALSIGAMSISLDAFMMMKHNHKIYIKLMKMLKCKSYCWCCPELISKSMYKYKDIDIDLTDTNIVTTSSHISDTPQSIGNVTTQKSDGKSVEITDFDDGYQRNSNENQDID